MNDDALTPDLRALKSATCLQVSAIGDQQSAARVGGVSQPQISNYCSFRTNTFIPLQVLFRLESFTDTDPDFPLITRTMARLHGFELVRLPSSSGSAEPNFVLLGRLLAAVGQVARIVGDAEQSCEQPPAVADALDRIVQAAVELKAQIGPERE